MNCSVKFTKSSLSLLKGVRQHVVTGNKNGRESVTRKASDVREAIAKYDSANFLCVHTTMNGQNGV